MKNDYKVLKPYLLLWSTQSLSALGSAMTNFALVIWLYQKSGSALETALLSVCSYAPYVMMSIFAGAVSDRWNKKRTMLVCDLLAALTTVGVLVLLRTGTLMPWHMYLLNAFSGLMNTVQQPAGEVAATLLIPKAYYQKTSALRSFSQSLNTILMPVLAAALYGLSGMEGVIAADLGTFLIAFMTLLFFIRIPEKELPAKEKEPLLSSARAGLKWLRLHPLVLTLMLFLAAINFVASMYSAVLPAMILSKPAGGEGVLGLVNTCTGVATLLGSLLAMALPRPKNRVRAVCLTLLVSMSTENFLLAVGKTPWVWCVGAVLGWLPIPLMNASLDVINRTSIPPDMQGRVFSCRNTLQFFTIPAGYLLGGLLTDQVFEPLMARYGSGWPAALFGAGKGAGAAALFAVLGVLGALVCAIFTLRLRNRDWYAFSEDN